MDYIPRHVTDIMISRIKDERISVLTGASQTGKTTLCEVELPRITKLPFTYISFDDPDERLRFQKAAVSILEALKTPLVILDEVQKIPALFDPLKYVVDRQQKEGKTPRQVFILTGSSQFLLLKNVRETLAGRIAMHTLYPFSLPEVIGGSGQTLLTKIWQIQKVDNEDVKRFYSLSRERVRKMVSLRDAHQAWGGYPPVWQKDDEIAKIGWLRNYRKTYLERDISDVGQVADIDTFARAQKLLCARTANILSVSEVARDLSLSVNTVKRYVSMLDLSFQCVLLSPFFANVGKRLVKSPKIYFPDTGLIRTILGELSISTGAMYESWVFSELNKWRQLQPLEPDLFFYRTGGGREINFLIAERKKILPLEVKSHDQVSGSDGRNVEAFLKEYSPAALVGLVIYPGMDFIEIRKNVWAVPDWYVFALNQQS